MDPLQKVQIGKTGLRVTRLGLGGAPLGGLFKDVQGVAAVATIRRALEMGINFFDTAPLYGHGKSEKWMGQGLAGIPGTWTLRFTIDGPQGQGTGELAVDVLKQPGPPLPLSWAVGLIPLTLTVVFFGVVWLRTGRSPAEVP